MYALSRNLRFAYPLAIALILAPLMEIAVRLWPLQLYLVQWRFQTELAAINTSSPIMLGFVLMGAIAYATESVSVLRVVAVLSALMGLLLLPALVMFMLDGEQVRQMAQSNVRDALRNNVLVAFVKGGLSAVAALSLAIGAWRAASALDEAPVRREPSLRRDEADEADVFLVSPDR